jgi:carboxyl-terminal processing protease
LRWPRSEASPRRKGQDKPIEISITRARIQVRSVRSRLEGDDVGFIRVTQFNEQTTQDLKKAITGLTAQAGARSSAAAPHCPSRAE